ncbi:GH16 domain-containing protein [Mycena venus]|uniref:GH16 domain-containing protein n=1 Tax=Mycena venus TaxID=2733690 RepID=A0A8H6YDU7_9AGAR|nr:GH16 domain-containing protein [Mycena venus]
MPAISALVLFALPLVALAAPHSDTVLRRHPNIHQNASLEARTTYTLKDHYTGKDFFEATSKGLAYVQNDGTTVLAVDSTSKLSSGENRNSVRISSPNSYTYGLFIADIYAMPHGPTVWPAYWTVGPNWPAGGEIDIIEGVGDSTSNQMTLHTSSDCSLDQGVDSDFTGQATNHPSCASSGSDNDGCGITDFAPHVYGHNFNLLAGGVYAHIVAASGIKIWHFPRTAIPADITAQKPNPANWGKPAAFWSASTCNIADHFKDHVITFDTTLCGDWAGNAFPGGMDKCLDAVEDPDNFALAQWKLNYVSVYES